MYTYKHTHKHTYIHNTHTVQTQYTHIHTQIYTYKHTYTNMRFEFTGLPRLPPPDRSAYGRDYKAFVEDYKYFVEQVTEIRAAFHQRVSSEKKPEKAPFVERTPDQKAEAARRRAAGKKRREADRKLRRATERAEKEARLGASMAKTARSWAQLAGVSGPDEAPPPSSAASSTLVDRGKPITSFSQARRLGLVEPGRIPVKTFEEELNSVRGKQVISTHPPSLGGGYAPGKGGTAQAAAQGKKPFVVTDSRSPRPPRK